MTPPELDPDDGLLECMLALMEPSAGWCSEACFEAWENRSVQ